LKEVAHGKEIIVKTLEIKLFILVLHVMVVKLILLKETDTNAKDVKILTFVKNVILN